MVLATQQEVTNVCEADNLCSGVKAGIEAAMHAMTSLFADEPTVGLLLVDALNAFSFLSRPAMLWNC